MINLTVDTSRIVVPFEAAAGVSATVARAAVKDSMGPMLSAIKGRIRSRTGLLKLGTRLKIARDDRPGTAAMLITAWVTAAKFAAKRGGNEAEGVKSRFAGKEKSQYRVYYGRMVEFGHGGPHPAPEHSFARAGFDETVESTADAIEDRLMENVNI